MKPAFEPRIVLLFSGHMVDAPDRETPRFPPAMEPDVAASIERTLDALGPTGDDLAVCSGACGGDLLFAEAALKRGVRVELYLPFDEATFVGRSVDFAGADWHARFDAVRSASALHLIPD